MLSRCSESQTLCRLCHIYLQSQPWRTTLCSLGSADSVPCHRCVVPLFTTFGVFSEHKCSPELQGANDGSDSKASAYNAGDPGSIPGQEDPLEKEMATHSSTLAWKTPWMEERDRLQSMGLQSQTRLHFHFQCPPKENLTNGV